MLSLESRSNAWLSVADGTRFKLHGQAYLRVTVASHDLVLSQAFGDIDEVDFAGKSPET
jgi:hypothetical protein